MTMKHLFFSTVLLAAMLGLQARPAWAADKEQRQMAADLRMLQEQTQQLQIILTSLTDALKAVNSKLDEQTTLTRKAFADEKLLIDGLAGDVRIVRERLDETNVRLTSLSQELEGLRVSIPMPSAPPPDTSSTSAAPTAPTAPPGAPPTASVTPPPTTNPANPGMPPQRVYDMAWADYVGGQWSLAIGGFEAYLKSFPKSELADNAQYYIGESYFADNKFKEAIAAYDIVIESYPGTDAVPDAYYKKGLALQRLNRSDEAREAFEFLVKTYPDSDAGRLAAQRLKPGRSPED
jgi:tol-pal system protein YbgF